MKLENEVVIACLISLIWIGQSHCDELSDTSGINKWTCKCSSYQGNRSYALKSNCSASCDCIQDVEGSGSMWTCTCGDGFPKVASYNLDTNCFTACNCTSGPLSTAQDSKKHISSKVVVIILLLCVLLTTFAFLASAMCYFYRRDKCPIQTPMFSSDIETSCNSATNLISLRTSSVLATKVTADFPINPSTGCFLKASSLIRSKRGNTHGTIIQFSYSQLESATEKFSNSNLIGVGGSSYVYHGRLKNGRTVAIKRLRSQRGPDAEFLFLTEIELLSRLHHYHVVPLLGYCSESLGKNAERLLVFEYMPNGNLRESLDGGSGKDMDWATRVAIAIGAARGLEYLHEAAAPRILHSDVKSTNILLDENWKAKITDLGMAKCLRADGLPSSSNSPAKMQGTFGYFAPEYAIVGKASLKSDVFSFGVVLLELISGRQPIYKSTSKGEESLVIWATPRLQDSRRVITDLPDPRLNGNFPEEEMQIMAYLAKECLLLDPDDRPTMSEVVQILSTITPEKSRRRNLPVYLYQRSSPHRMKSESSIQRSYSQVEKTPASSSKWSTRCSLQLSGPIDAEEVRPAPPSKESNLCSLAGNIDSTPRVGNNTEEADTVSAENIERLILLTSNKRSQHDSDDETVDLTEPRLESFCMNNIKTP
ncbi:receptor-like serine/threonine-protein kinase NCRK [Corylus avellana]|uniref:receptor-like serine/threonine-protein kinase NCRK n=1 Tax=Corylus avellana TaxID=13451 RepID=UPI00286D20CD|nr:receptor-like serine/threonine-protein kinase NCRK [Corylus avellana]XP_059429502.1 receptor-like serine/threonine-protein kinase NCRK [Corylus avellana]XP_059429503.1 receptor-like serine/threonine-protein kinase NCRK [Corylus avellana]XP_059429505.1 receptor-like serine/threonine-protein kinase NCRK [Corylus avellana]XP_059429506.1 receptor-like serine/threonine-protein kinase NCRK [Corylus avellana]